MEKIIRRGDVYYADLNHVVGSEQGGVRPVLVVQNDVGNKHSPTVVVAALTSNAERKMRLPIHFLLKGVRGLKLESVVLTEQLRTIDKRRLTEFVCSLDSKTMSEVDRAIMISLGLIEPEKQKEMVLTLCPTDPYI